MGLTDKALEILLGALLVVALWFFAEQELVLHHEISGLTAQLAVERECRVGSSCSKDLLDESARGAAMVQQAREDAAAQVAAQKAAADKQAADAVRGLEAAQAAAGQGAVNWKKRYQDLLSAPDCAAWARQAVACAVR